MRFQKGLLTPVNCCILLIKEKRHARCQIAMAWNVYKVSCLLTVLVSDRQVCPCELSGLILAAP